MGVPYDDLYALERKHNVEELYINYINMGGNGYIRHLLEDGLITPNEYRRSIGLEPLRSESIHRIPYYSEKDIPKVLNCPNCGAPITGCKCEYCGTVFKEEPTQRFYADGVEYLKEKMLKIKSDEMNYNTYESMINATKDCHEKEYEYLSKMTRCEQEKIYETSKKKSFIGRLLNR